jgi:hypothetical protein
MKYVTTGGINPGKMELVLWAQIGTRLEALKFRTRVLKN